MDLCKRSQQWWKGVDMERLTDKFWRNFDPWECCGQDKYCKRGLDEEGGCINGCKVPKLYRRLAEYEDAEEQGLLPRFHLGDEFWALRLGRVVKAKVVMLQQKKDGTWKYRFSLEISSTYHDTVDYEQIEYGKYFWSTKEEAEQKLAEMKGE